MMFGKVKNVCEYEHEIFDTTSYYVSALLFEHWNLDETFVEILKIMDYEPKESMPRIEYYRDILNVVRTAINVKGILTHATINEASKLVKEMGLSDETFLHIAHRMKKTYEQSKGVA